MRNAIRSTVAAAVLAVTLASAAFAAAAIDGKWVGTLNGPEGPIQAALEVKAEGEKLTGSMNFASMGATAISNGKITGNDISFDLVLGDGAFTLPFKGKLDGDKLALTIESPMGAETVAFTRAPAS
jgi:hypothetical protein